MPGLIGKKIGMTSFYSADGKNLPCTVLEVGPCVVTQVKTVEKDGYEALQIGYGSRKEKNVPAALQGHFKKNKLNAAEKLAEFKNFEEEYKEGDEINVNLFNEGDFVKVTGVSKGKGFQGVVKRHNFGGVGQATHGQHNRLRAPGSIGAGSTPSKVVKGMNMAGQMGNKRVSIENLEVVKVKEDKNLLVVKGSVPGPKGSVLLIRK